MPRLPPGASARRMGRRISLTDGVRPSASYSDDDDFVCPPTRNITGQKYVPPVSRCVPSSVSSIIKDLKGEKELFVNEMGFGGLLNMPEITTHRAISYWLLTRLSCDTHALQVGDGTLLPFSEDDVHKVFGIPSSGKDLDPPSSEVIAQVKGLICTRLKVEDYKHVNRAVLEDVITKNHRGRMSKEDKDAFKTAFLILVMTKFLAPQKFLDNICPKYFTAIINPDDISSYNWSGYVLNELLAAAEDVQKKFAEGERCGYVNGCVIFLQVFYLDNLDFGNLSLPHDVFPRIAVYDRDNIKKRCIVDLTLKDKFTVTQFGQMQLRPQRNVCYTRSNEFIKSKQRQDIGDGPSNVNIQKDSQAIEHAAHIIQQAKKMNILWASCITNLDKAREDIVKVAEACKLLANVEQTNTNEDELSRGYTCTLDNDVEDVDEHHAPEQTRPVCNEELNNEEINNNVGSAPNVTINIPSYNISADHSNSAQEYTPTVVLESRSKASIDLNRSVHTKNESGSTSKTTCFPPRMESNVDMDRPSFDIGIDLSPVQTQEICYRNPNIGTNQPTAVSPEIMPKKCSISPRSRSREIAVSSLVVLQDIYIENSKGDIKPVTGIKREYPEPRILDFEQFRGNKRFMPPTVTPFQASIITPVRVKHEYISMALINWIKKYQDVHSLRSSWVTHDTPTYITVTGMELRTFIEGNEKMDHTIASLYTRRMIQMEYEMFGNTPANGWRHFLEPDFSMRAIASDNWWDPEFFRVQFTSGAIKNDVSKCEIIFVPLCDTNHWSCFAFNLRKRVVHILDSNKTGKGEDIDTSSNHFWIRPPLFKALQQCMTLFFSDWSEDITKWDCKEAIVPTHYSEVDSGIYTIQFMKNWDGNMCVRDINQDYMDTFRMEILTDILTLEANLSSPPDFVKELLKQFTDHRDTTE